MSPVAAASAALEPPIRATAERGGEIERIVLDRPKANVLDIEMLGAIRNRVRALSASPGNLKLLVFEGAGAHFSFGASVPEHLPENVGTLVPLFHRLFRDLDELGAPTAAIVRGQCLGGALELASWCGMVFASPEAKLGVPEASLGVFPPVANLTIPWRTGGARAARLAVTGEILDAGRSLAWGLVDDVSDDPDAALAGWFEKHLSPKSAVAIRYAWRAARRPLTLALRNDLPDLEKLYLDDLMTRRDPVEGLTAFLEKRPPVWRHE